MPGLVGCDERIEAVLSRGEIDVLGRLPWSSNATFLAKCTLEGVTVPAVYKPARGERPLWDFPGEIFRREVAAFMLSETLGWGLVPPTVARDDGPLGRGSIQQFVMADFEQQYFTLLADGARHDALRAICAFDVVANNADRKGGHCLLVRSGRPGAGTGPESEDGLLGACIDLVGERHDSEIGSGIDLADDSRVWAIDHGVCFHADPKLRTVIWDFAGEPVPEHLLDDLRRLVAGGLPDTFRELLDGDEIDAVVARAAELVTVRVFPEPVLGPRGYPPYPWPLV